MGEIQRPDPAVWFTDPIVCQPRSNMVKFVVHLAASFFVWSAEQAVGAASLYEFMSYLLWDSQGQDGPAAVRMRYDRLKLM